MSRIPPCGIFLLLLLLVLAGVPAQAQNPLFNQCPPIGSSTGCAYLVTVMDGARSLLTDPTQQPVDGIGNVILVGAQNSSSIPLTSLPLNGNGFPILAFSGNGLCHAVPSPAGCPFGPTGYEGPGTSFTNIGPDQTSGTVVFDPPIPPGGHAYFAVAGFVSAPSSPLSVSCTPNAGPLLYSVTCIASGGPGAYQWALAGKIPPGVLLSATSGSLVTVGSLPATLGAYGFSVQVTDNSIPAPQLASRYFADTSDPLGGTCNNTLSAGSVSVGPSGSRGFVVVGSPQGCPPWQAFSSASWVTIVNGVTGTGSGTVNFSVGANEGLPRSTTLSIAGQSFLVNQLTGCQFGITPTGAAVSSAGGSGTITVGALSSECPWNASPDADSAWLTLNGKTNGNGAGSVSFVAAANPSSTSRVGTIQMADQTFTVAQGGTHCSYSLPQSTQAFPAAGGIGSVTVLAPPGCRWSIYNTLPWVTFHIISGTGNGTATYIVAANPSTTVSRTGSAQVAGLPFAVTQESASPLFCVASAPSPNEVALEGRTEVMGDLVLRCQGIPSALIADISLALNTNVTNAVSDLNTSDAVLTVNGGSPQNGLISGYNVIHWSGVSLTPGAGGVTTVRISQVRADASLLPEPANLQSVAIKGLVTVNSVIPVPVSGALQIDPAGTAQSVGVILANAGPTLNFQILPPPPTAYPAGAIVVQFQEGSPTAFHAASETGATTRLRLLLTGVPAGLQIMAPVSSSGGAAQLYSADLSGAGGDPISGSQSSLTVTDGTASATWVVQSADPAQLDSYTFVLSMPNVAGFDMSQMRVLGSLGPVSAVNVASATAPVPRYRNFPVPQYLVGVRTLSSTQLLPRAANWVLFGNQVLNDNPSQTATNVVLHDRVPAGARVQNCQASDGGVCTMIGNEAVATFPALQPGQAATVVVSAIIDPTLPAGTVVQSLVSAAGDQTNADPTAAQSSSIFIVGEPGRRRAGHWAPF